MPENERDYLLDENETRILFVLGGIGAVALLVLLLVLMSARPQGRFTPANQTQYQRTVVQEAEALSSYGREEGTDRVAIPIERAMVLLVERGVSNVRFAQASSAATTQGGADAQSGTGGAAPLPDGEAIYVSNCSACHQANGEGVPGAFPPLAGHAPELYSAQGGRDYLANVLLYGLQGEIQVNGETYNGVMPAWQQLRNDQLAAVLNYVLSAWGNDVQDFQPYTAEDIAPHRDQGLSAGDVYERRQALGLP